MRSLIGQRAGFQLLALRYGNSTFRQGDWGIKRVEKGMQRSSIALHPALPLAGGLLWMLISTTCRSRYAACLCICLLLTGCGVERESLFEEEHALPAHWPSSLVDAADKIDERLSRVANLRSASNYETERSKVEQWEFELRDLVEWIPEVAADTDLTETQWLPIYEICEVMRKHLSRGDVSAFDIEEDFRRLQTLLLESAKFLPSATDAVPAEDSRSVFHDSTEPATTQTLDARTSSGDES